LKGETEELNLERQVNNYRLVVEQISEEGPLFDEEIIIISADNIRQRVLAVLRAAWPPITPICGAARRRGGLRQDHGPASTGQDVSRLHLCGQGIDRWEDKPVAMLQEIEDELSGKNESNLTKEEREKRLRDDLSTPLRQRQRRDPPAQ